MAIQDPRNFFLNSVEDRFNAADELVARHKKQLQTRYNKRLADKANKAVDTVFYAAKDESPEDEAKRKKGEISKMLGRDEDMGRKLVRGASRSGGLSGADVEAAMQMGAKGRDIEAATQMAADKNRSRAETITEGLSRKPVSEKGTGAMLVKKTGDKNFYDQVGIIPKAKVVAEDELVQSFFAKAHGGSYDPNSRVDKAKMQKILGMVNAQPELLSLTPGKFAVKLYTAK